MNLSKEISLILAQTSCIELVTHELLDGDALGSVTALALMLSQQGKKVGIAKCCVPDYLSSLYILKEFENCEFKSGEFVRVFLDVQEKNRVGVMTAATPCRVIVIDHHEISDNVVKGLHLIEREVSTCSLLIKKRFINILKCTDDILKYLCIGILTDSGWCMRAEALELNTLAVAAKKGIYVRELREQTSTPQSLISLINKGNLLASTESIGGFYWIEASKNIIGKNAGFLASQLQQTNAEKVAIISRSRGTWGTDYQFTLRSNGEFDCSSFAKKYGGGGHEGAAGFKCDEEEYYEVMDKLKGEKYRLSK